MLSTFITPNTGTNQCDQIWLFIGQLFKAYSNKYFAKIFFILREFLKRCQKF